MSRRRVSQKANGIASLIIIIAFAIMSTYGAIKRFIFINRGIIVMVLVIVAILLIVLLVVKVRRDKLRRELLAEILSELHLENIDNYLKEYDDRITVKSRQTLNNYSDLKYFKEKDCFELVRKISDDRKAINSSIKSFLQSNNYSDRPQYGFVEKQLETYAQMANGYKVKVVYITSAGNLKGERILHISSRRVDELVAHPEYLMTKGEHNKLLKQQEKDELENKKRSLYDRVNKIIDFANQSKDALIVKSRVKALDDLVQKLFDSTVNSIQKIKKIDSEEWNMIGGLIDSVDEEIKKIVEDDNRISEYYKSDDFAKIKETCDLITQSQKEFNEYINEKAQSITQLFGTRIVRNETENEDVYNYIRAYKKSITPFTAEVSSAVFGSAENNPIDYIIKYFYPNKNQYKTQIERLRILIEELETLKEAKVIIDNYKKDYDQYIQDVPDYVMENDEDGFYSRLGLAIIDEAVLNVEYRFAYTSNGGMAQRSFAVPMTEENISELIYRLESKLTTEALAKEQRALMTAKLRTQIKERDNYTCCQCGNSTHKEPNLLLEIDHIIPVSKGGLTKEDNLQTLCWKCNRNKGAKIL